MAKTIAPNETLATVFADLNDKVIIEAGPQNDKPAKGDNGFLVNILLPRRFANYATEAANFVSANWFGKRESNGKFGEIENLAEKVAAIETFLETSWEPTEARVKSPVEQAVFNRICSLQADKLVGASGRQIDASVMPAVLAVINNPEKTESGAALVKSFLPLMRNWKQVRTRKGQGTSETESGPEIVADI